MDLVDFLDTIYLGDRMCSAISIDGVSAEIRLHIDVISRGRGAQWDFYSEEDVSKGALVFEGVRNFSLGSGRCLLPNAWIEVVSATRLNDDLSEVAISLGNVDSNAVSTELVLTLACQAVSIETADGQRIRS